MNQEFDPAAASGEQNFRGVRPLELNEVLLNGDDRDGGFFRKRVLIGRADRNTKPEEIALTRTPAEGENAAPLSVVFLKIRRKLVERGKGGEIIRSTNEHNHKGEVVTLYESGTKNKQTGVASDLRERFEGLRTVQIVYALLLTNPHDPEVVRLVLKGSALGSEVKNDNVVKFYDYLNTFSGEDHFYNFKTILQPVIERGKKTYYTINFQRGDRLSDAGQKIAIDRMREVHVNCLEVDKARAAKVVAAATVDDIVPEALEDVEEGVDYPKDDINPDDIPF